ncbi:hypothetical protein PC123_g3193 [Phytophthora cactorum]|nr:hypothetical protein PC123_g3193 [Phytophthora cactorum]
MPVRRGVVASVVRTVSFHVATFAYACVLGAFFAISGSLLLLLVGCLLVGSSQFARKLTKVLWRTEMAIDALVADNDELGSVLRRRRSSHRTGQDVPEQEDPVLGEVTLPVMLLSLLYFLVFKWILDMIFSAVPLILWVVSLAQVLPKDAGLSDVNIVSTGTTAAQVFAAVAFAFLAHQLGVTSARGLLFVSRNVAQVLFSRNNSEETREQSVDGAPFATEGRIGQEERHIGAAASNNYGTMGGKHPRSHLKSNSASVSNEKLSAEAVTRNLYQDGRSASESSVPRSRGPRDMKQQPASFDGAYVPPGMPPMPPSRPLPHVERAFQDDMHHHDDDQEFQMCCCKVVIKSDAKETDESDSRQGGSGARGGRRGGGRRGNSRGGSTWGRGGGRGDLGLDQMRLDMRGPPAFPHFNGEFPPWGAEWRARWLEHWSHWQDWRWPTTDQRRQGKRRRGMRRRNSFDDVYAVAVPVATTLSDAEDDAKKEPAHTSMYEALDLTPSAPPLSSRRGSFDAHWERPDSREQGDRDHHRRDSMHKSWSEPIGRRSLKEYSQAEYSQAMGTSESDEDESDGDFRSNKRDKDDAMRGLLWDQHQRTDGSFKGAFRNEREVAGEADGTAGLFRQNRVEWKQRHYEKKVQKYEQKLRAAQEKLDKRREEHAARQERSIDARERDRYAREIEQVADEAFHAPRTKQDSVQMRLQSSGDAKASAPRHTTPAAPPVPTASPVLPAAPSAPVAPPVPPPRRAPLTSTGGDPRKRALSSRVRGRPSTLTDHQVRSTSNTFEQHDRVEHNEREDKGSVSIAPVSQAGSSRDISDLEILGHYGSITRSYEDDDVTNMRAYAPLSYTDSPPQYITALDPSPIYRGSSDQPDYDSFSPMNSPRSSGAGRGSFDVDHVYDLLSPTNSIHDADFPTDKFQQVYRSIQMAAVPESRRSMAAEKGGLEAKSEFKGVSGRRDRVNFSAFAPPSVCLSPKPFQFTVWAFLLNQRSEMQELAKSDHPESRKLSLESKLDVRRGALVHVTLEVPNGFEVLNGATQGFAWEGNISSVDYDVMCTEGAAFGRVLFKARITVGSSVAVLNSFVLVGSRVMEPSELEVDVLEGWMDVMEQTYREIPFRSLEMKELVGKGYFGDAYRASLDGQDVVVKTIRASEFGDTTSQIVREFQHEAAMLNMFGHHPCIVPFVGASTDTKFPLALVTKYLPYGSLEDNLRGSSSLSIDERTGMLKDAAAGLLNIHEGGFIHRDLAARNCLVDQGSRVRICDFGLCRRVRSETAGMLMKDAVGPVKYMAPESLQPPHAFSYDSDVYMFGVLMWETYTSSLPFASLTPVEAMMHVLRGERLPVPKELPESLQTLMQNCFHDSPAERPSMQEVVTALDNSLVSSQLCRFADKGARSIHLGITRVLHGELRKAAGRHRHDPMPKKKRRAFDEGRYRQLVAHYRNIVTSKVSLSFQTAIRRFPFQSKVKQMASPRWTAEHDELLLSVAGHYSMWPERVQAFTNELHKRRDFLPMPEPAFTLPEIQNHLNELCEIAPTGPVKSLSKGWYPKRTELLQTIDNNTIGESNEVKTVLFNHAVKEKGWNFSATIEQVKWKLGRLPRNGQHTGDANVPTQPTSVQQCSGTKRTSTESTGTWFTRKRQNVGNYATTNSFSVADDAENEANLVDNGYKRGYIVTESDGSDIEHTGGDGVPTVVREEPVPSPDSGDSAGTTKARENIGNHGHQRVEIKVRREVRTELEQTSINSHKETSITGGETMTTHLRLLVNNKLMSDVVFVVEGTDIFAHKCICIRSPFFKTLLSGEISQSRALRVKIADVSRATFLALVEYVYTDKVNVSSDNVELFVAADRFGIESLKKQCSKKLLESLCIDNAAKTLLAAIQHNDPVLRDTCFSFTLRNLEKVSKTKSFHEMAKRDPEMVVKIVQKVSTLVHIA